MADIKEIKSLHIVSYTLMTSSVSAVLMFLYRIVMLIIGLVTIVLIPSQIGPLAGAQIGLYAAMLIVYPVGTFVLNIIQAFLMALIYNILVPRIGGIKLELE